LMGAYTLACIIWILLKGLWLALEMVPSGEFSLWFHLELMWRTVLFWCS
jgi:hypothetical protein